MGEKNVGFAVGDYDQNFMLALDPGYSTYLGGSGADRTSSIPTNNGIAVDSWGNAYITGKTKSTDFPTLNPYQGSYGGGFSDAFVTKLDSNGNTLIYSTYLGGDTDDEGHGIAVDSSGNAYVTGFTWSSDFPTLNPYQGSHGGGFYDVFVTKLDSSGDTLIYSTYLGGNGEERGNGIAVDSSSNAYVAGYTKSTNFPTQNPYQGSNAGESDAFVTKLSSGGDTLTYSTYLGGSSSDYGNDVAVDNSGNAYITGRTYSSDDFPTLNPHQGSFGGGSYDAFVTKLSSGGDALIHSTYLGGNSYDEGYGIAVDSSGNAYVAGYTRSSDFPTQNPYQGSNAGESDAFVTKLSSGGDTLIYSTYLGGSDDSGGYDIAVDSLGNAYVTGNTQSTDFPTLNPHQGSYGGGYCDAFVTKLSSNGSALIYSTYLGGSSSDYGHGIAVYSSGNAYVVGYTDSTDFPTLNPYQSSHGGGEWDAFVASYLQDGSLPVELSLLTATASADGVTIRWRTETEVGNIGFRIYRSEEKDGNYTKIAFVDGAGNSAMPIDYQFTDANVEPGKTYFYYLEDIDIAGEKSSSEIIKVVVPPAKPAEPIPKEFRLLQNYPNPFNPETWLPYELAADATVTIRIYDVNGQLVRQLDLGKQKAGRYVDKEKAAYWDGKDQIGKAFPADFISTRSRQAISKRPAGW